MIRHRAPEDVQAEADAKVSDLLADLSWRATRYAMDGKRLEHDLMVEALASARGFLLGEQNDGRLPCTCKFPDTQPNGPTVHLAPGQAELIRFGEHL